VLGIVAISLLAWHWSPGRQVELHQGDLCDAVGDRNWKRVGSLLATDYHDRWGQDRTTILARLPQAFMDFLACGVLEDHLSLTWRNGACDLAAHIRIVGSGGPLAQAIMEQSTQLTEPFHFQWKKQSWKPWDWKLVSVDQPQVEIPDESEFQ
jgi:hypothetical protein